MSDAAQENADALARRRCVDRGAGRRGVGGVGDNYGGCFVMSELKSNEGRGSLSCLLDIALAIFALGVIGGLVWVAAIWTVRIIRG